MMKILLIPFLSIIFYSCIISQESLIEKNESQGLLADIICDKKEAILNKQVYVLTKTKLIVTREELKNYVGFIDRYLTEQDKELMYKKILNRQDVEVELEDYVKNCIGNNLVESFLETESVVLTYSYPLFSKDYRFGIVHESTSKGGRVNQGWYLFLQKGKEKWEVIGMTPDEQTEQEIEKKESNPLRRI
jgi:hypothetical protein